MKIIPLLILVLTLAVGIFLQTKSNTTSADNIVEDTVDSSMAAPQKADIPL